jgi:hypothetical protein
MIGRIRIEIQTNLLRVRARLCHKPTQRQTVIASERTVMTSNAAIETSPLAPAATFSSAPVKSKAGASFDAFLIGSKVSFKFKSSTLLKVDAALADGNLAIPGYVALSEVAVVVADSDFQADLIFLTCKANDEPVILPAAGILVAIDAVSSAHAVLAVRFEKRCRRTNRLVERGQDPAPRRRQAFQLVLVALTFGIAFMNYALAAAQTLAHAAIAAADYFRERNFPGTASARKSGPEE